MAKIQLSLSRLLLIVLLVIPVILIIIYAVFLATDRFESSASVYITEEQGASSALDLSSLGFTTSSNSREIMVLKAFIDSQGMMMRLDKDLHLLDHFSSSGADIFSRLETGAPIEIAYEYYKKRIKTNFDDQAQLLEISVQTFDSEFSKKVLDRILAHSQDFIDQLNEQIKSSQLLFFQAEVKTSENELIEARNRLTEFQRKNAIFSTDLATKTIGGTISGLEKQLAARQADLSSRLGVLDESSPTVKRIRAEIEALKDQINKENSRLASDKGNSLSELDSKFREIELLIEYKTLRYKANLQAYEQAQLDTARRLRFLTIVAEPTVAESALYPDRIYMVITGSILAFVFYFLVTISIAIIREHS